MEEIKQLTSPVNNIYPITVSDAVKVNETTKLTQVLDSCLKTSGGTIDGNGSLPLTVKGGTSGYQYNIQLLPAASWSGILFCGNDKTTSGNGTSAKSYWVGNNDGQFSIALNGSGNTTKSLYCNGTDWYANQQKIVLNNDSRLSDSRPASDVYTWAKSASKPSYTATEVGAVPNVVTYEGLTEPLVDNSIYTLGQVNQVSLNIPSSNKNGIVIYFTASSTGCTVSYASSTKWIGDQPSCEANKNYMISILDGICKIEEYA